MKLEPDQSPDDPEVQADQTRDQSRREALQRLGKYSAYTAPFLLAMLSSEAAAQGFSGD
jgi:hypothetical protein